MRMRRKKNLEARLEACGDYILYLDRDEKNFQDKSNKQLIDFEKIFGNSDPLVLEIGCGKGQFAREIAKRNPDKNFLAVEKSSNVIVDAAQMAIDEGIPNLRFARGEAEYLDCFIPEKSVECIYLNFSCPYPKNTYARHRLTYRAFLEIYRRILVDKGEIYQKTDNMHFFEFSLEEFSAANYGLKNISLELHNSGLEGNIVTEYEKILRHGYAYLQIGGVRKIMSEQINPIVSEKDMGADGKLRKWSTGRKAKWIIWIVVILAAALGFWHQHYMRSDSQIKAVFDDNKPTLPKGKCSIKSLTENNACKSVKKELEELERRNVTYIDSDGLTVKFYTIYDHYYIYRSPISSSGGEDNLGNGWSYVKTSKS